MLPSEVFSASFREAQKKKLPKELLMTIIYLNDAVLHTTCMIYLSMLSRVEMISIADAATAC